MEPFKIRLRKETFLKTLILRFILYTCLIAISAVLLYYSMLYFNNYEILSILFFLIALLGILIIQYVLYANSRNKNISYYNFKNAIKLIEPRNPIIFLFPEFELMYILKDSVSDRINPDKFINLIDRIDPEKFQSIINEAFDEKKAMAIEAEFKKFIAQNLNILLDCDLVIKVRGRGKAIFDDLVDDFPALNNLAQLTDQKIVLETSKIRDSNILIFDDSLRFITSAHIINMLQELGCKKIVFLCVIAQNESLIHLKEEYQIKDNVIFLQFKVLSKTEYMKFYADYMFGYLDRVTRSSGVSDNYIKLKIDRLITKEEFIKLFEDKRNSVYEVKRIVDKNNEYKISVECRWIYDKIKNDYTKKIKMEMVKIRFFIKLIPSNDVFSNGVTQIELSPVLVPRNFSRNLPFNSKSRFEQFCQLDKLQDIDPETKDFIFCSCLIHSLNNDFIESFMEYFKKQLIKYKMNIIEEEIKYTLPVDIMV